jgi:hydroxyquinol 1,2-dioxygenase
VFGAKPSLVIDYVANTDVEAAQEWGLPSPFFDVQRDFVLSRSKA